MKKIIKLALCLGLMLVSVYLIYDYYKDQTVNSSDIDIISDDEDLEVVSKFRNKYKNSEIVLYIEFPDLVAAPIVQTENNIYYKEHDIYKKDNAFGTPFLDYRNKSLADKKLIVYGNGKDNFSFSKLLNYSSKSFYDNHSDINVYTENGKKVYKIFSVFREKEDFSYLDLNGFPGLEYYEHILKLKDKSLYDTGVPIEDDSKTLVIELCALEEGCTYNPEYQVIIAKEIKQNHNE